MIVVDRLQFQYKSEFWFRESCSYPIKGQAGSSCSQTHTLSASLSLSNMDPYLCQEVRDYLVIDLFLIRLSKRARVLNQNLRPMKH